MKKTALLLCLITMFSLKADVMPIALFSFPKSGTHFIKELYLHLTGVEIALDHPHHYFGSFSLETLKVKYGTQKILFLLRDPRDVVVSYIHWVDELSLEERQFWGAADWDKWTTEEKITEIIVGEKQPIMKYDVQFIPSLEKELKERENAYVARFEDFIGPKAGGSKEKQLEIVGEIAYFITNQHLNSDAIEQLIDASFGHSKTFRNPTISKWKYYFTDQHKMLFKESIWGQVLIELGYEIDSNW